MTNVYLFFFRQNKTLPSSSIFISSNHTKGRQELWQDESQAHLIFLCKTDVQFSQNFQQSFSGARCTGHMTKGTQHSEGRFTTVAVEYSTLFKNKQVHTRRATPVTLEFPNHLINGNCNTHVFFPLSHFQLINFRLTAKVAHP